jgi:hypothetical protein
MQMLQAGGIAPVTDGARVQDEAAMRAAVDPALRRQRASPDRH